tara:strand:- start:430 stop:861 length:432 start_codon:yes stop_codon:yes gene_type:complete
MTGYSADTAQFLEGASAGLERENMLVFNRLIAGEAVPGITDSHDGVDRGLVRFEQSFIQGQLNALRAEDPEGYSNVIAEVNESFASFAWGSNPLLAAERNLGHLPDFANQADRQQIGYEVVRIEAAYSCAMGRACNPESLSGQ